MNETTYFEDTSDYLLHYGKGHLDGGHSGRYPWGSGEDGFQRYSCFLDEYNAAVAKYGEKNKKAIARELGIFNRWGEPYVKMLDARVSNAKAEEKMNLIVRVRDLADQGMGATEIGRIVGKRESSVRELLKEGREIRFSQRQESAQVLKDFVDEHRYVDIGPGAEQAFNMTGSSFKNTVALLVDQGYQQQTLKFENLGTNHSYDMTVLTPPDVPYSELSEHRYDVVNLDLGNISRTINTNGDVGALGIRSIESVDSKRIAVRYNEEGGKDKDGLIEIRPGVPDLALGNSDYAQVRIPVDGTHYIKGMAIYNSKLPPGVDILVNSNKHQGSPLKGYDDDSVLKVMKGIDKKTQSGTPDKDNPYGASVDQLRWKDKNGVEHDSSINVVHQEGEWRDWSRNLASQFLSKQPIPLAHRQLDMAYMDKKQQFEEICNLTNPTIKRKLLISFADDCDSTAVELKAAPFPGQQFHVIIPDPRLKDNEIYAPNYADGTRVALVRYPHGGKFEIAECTVRNTGSPSAELIGKNAPDAVCINSKVAGRLSGADFDGDTVVVIPESSKVKISVNKALTGPLHELADFDPKEAYPKYPGMKVITAQGKQTEMGKVSNLITDMTLQGADDADLAKAVKHSMVIIDAEKHELNWKKSEIDNDIAELKRRYQGKKSLDDNTEDGSGGAFTIISKAKGEVRVPLRKDWTESVNTIDPVTGEKIYQYPKASKATYDEVKLVGPRLKSGERVKVRKDTKADKLYYFKDVNGKKVKTYLNDDDFLESPESVKKRVQINTTKDGDQYYLAKDPVTRKTVRVPVTSADFAEEPRIVGKTQKSTRMAEEKDPFKLTSGGSKENPGYDMEREYATYATNMKALANAARLEWLHTDKLKVDKEASKKYKAEVDSLKEQLLRAESNAPLERQAQRNANRTIARKKEENPDIDKATLKKYKQKAIESERLRVGAKKKDRLIKITDNEWLAIQAGAISDSMLKRIIDNTDLDALKKRATPHESKRRVSETMKGLAKRMAAGDYTNQQIADRLGISPSTVYSILSGKE